VTGTIFISDDSKDKVFEVDASAPEVVISSFSTTEFGSADPEGIVFDPETGNLFVMDGYDRTIYEFTPEGDLVSSMLLPSEITDPEGISYNHCSDNFIIVSGFDPEVLFEVTRDGIIANIIDVNHLAIVRPKGVTFAPGSDSDGLNIVIADYGIDEENDGRLLEISVADITACSYRIHGKGISYEYKQDSKNRRGKKSKRHLKSIALMKLDVNTLSPETGRLKYSYMGTGHSYKHRYRMLYLRSTSIEEISVERDTAIIKGEGKVRRRHGYTFKATITDNIPDKIGIEIYNPDGTLYFSSEPDALRRGNFVIEEE
jgi:hypothetical protein